MHPSCFAVIGAAIVVAVLPTPGNAQAPNPCIQIFDISGLDGIRSNLGGAYCLQNDIDLSEVSSFTPIGGFDNPFTGSFDGGDKKIINLKIATTNNPSVGLFSKISGSVKNLHLVGVDVSGEGAHAGALAGILQSGTVTNVHSSGAVSGFSAGGLLGTVTNGTVRRSSSSASVQVSIYAGGLVGQLHGGKLLESYATGKTAGLFVAGGLVGATQAQGLHARISRCFATGTATATDTSLSQAGGLVALVEDNSEITDSYATGAVHSNSAGGAGGLVGLIAASTMKRTFSTGEVSGPADVGGLVGSAGPDAGSRRSFWDTRASGRSASALGRGKTTKDLTKSLPEGFDPDVWAIFPGRTYPYLTDVTPKELIPRPSE